MHGIVYALSLIALYEHDNMYIAPMGLCVHMLRSEHYVSSSRDFHSAHSVKMQSFIALHRFLLVEKTRPDLARHKPLKMLEWFILQTGMGSILN